MSGLMRMLQAEGAASVFVTGLSQESSSAIKPTIAPSLAPLRLTTSDTDLLAHGVGASSMSAGGGGVRFGCTAVHSMC